MNPDHRVCQGVKCPRPSDFWLGNLRPTRLAFSKHSGFTILYHDGKLNGSNMHRRKPESVAPNKREGWLQRGTSKKSLFSKPKGGSNGDEASATEPTSAGSSVLDFGLPIWEKPQDAVSREKYDKLPSPMKLQTAQQTVSSGNFPRVAPKLEPPRRLQHVPHPFHQQPQQEDIHLESGDELTDMVVTCNDSFNSISDDITFVSFDVDDQHRGQKYPASPRRRIDSPKKRSNRSNFNKPSSGSRHLVSVPEPPNSPRGGPPRKNFIWKKGPNGRYVKVPVGDDVVPGSAQAQRLPISEAEANKDEDDEALRRMEEEMLKKALEESAREASLQAPSSVSRSRPGLGYEPKTVTSSSRQPPSGPTVRLGSPAAQPNDFPGSSSVMSASNHSATVQAELEGQEEALIRLAMERSIRDTGSRPIQNQSDPLGASSTHTVRHRNGECFEDCIDRRSIYATTQVMRAEERNRTVYLHEQLSPTKNRDRNTVSQLPVTSSPRKSTKGKNFVWKKGPNNRYIKCPIAMDQVDEENEVERYDDERGSLSVEATQGGGLTRMEKAMVEEAMKRSMRDLYAGI